MRVNNLADTTQGIYITYPYPNFNNVGTRRLLIKKNTTSVTGWTEMSESNCGTNANGIRCQYNLPSNYATGNDLTLTVGS